MDNRFSGILGLARRAGKLTFGTDAAARDVADGKALLIVFSTDISKRTKDNLESACARYRVKSTTVPLAKSELGQAIGRGDTAVAAITDKGFVKKILEYCRAGMGKEDSIYDHKIQGS